MKPRTLALAGLIGLAALTRLLPHPPNFAPITAMAVFGAIRYRSRWAAGVTPLLALLVSDLVREVLYRNGLSRDWGLYHGMWVVYGTTALIVLLGRLAYGTRSPATIAATTLGARRRGPATLSPSSAATAMGFCGTASSPMLSWGSSCCTVGTTTRSLPL
jgi:hypothetical protein